MIKGVSMPTVNFGTFAKRRNSTKQPTNQLSDTRTVTLKDMTSYDAPTFILTGNDFSYNYAKWGNRYYFIVDVRSLHNNLCEVDCVLDPLATYKADILASTQYVCYSSLSGNSWLADTRIPVLKSTRAAKSTASMGSLFNEFGFYVLTAVGKDGCNTFACDISNLHSLLDKINDWSDDLYDDIYGNQGYTWGSTEEALENIGEILTNTGVVGNAYADAPSCIRSCIWVPFALAGMSFLSDTKRLFLGQFDTEIDLFTIKGSPATGSVSVSIPWHFSDWRRGYCEDVYLYLPLVGMVSLASDNLTHVSSITVRWSATATDGTVCYQVVAGNEIIGSYGGQCSANYPIGISQQASAGEIIQTAFAGAEKTVNAAINSSVSPVSVAGAAAGAVMSAAEATYNVANVTLSRHNSCIGGVGGGAGSGLDLNVTCFTVAHDTVCEPSDMRATMGVPTMKPVLLSSLSGFCQCANAHVQCAAQANELNAIDAMLNSGFYIE